ncbi:MAG TPA: hypothetical protein VFR84_11220 [Candidatus Angelobacter sp.]|nr:hypothetical protein [Candidatus Angelobacter sp.]
MDTTSTKPSLSIVVNNSERRKTSRDKDKHGQESPDRAQMELAADARESLSFFRPDIFFYGHVFELAGFKDIATFLAFNELSVFIASDDTHAWMPADFLHRDIFGEPVYERWILTRVHIRIKAHCRGACARIGRILSPSYGLSSA